MLKKISSSVWIALGVCSVFFIYFALNGLFKTPMSVQSSKYQEPLFSVITQRITPASIEKTLHMRGQTQALRKVIMRAQTAGQVTATPAIEGESLDANAVLCTLDLDSRQATHAQAQAAYEKALLDYQAMTTLVQKGFRSKTALANAKALLNKTKAQKERVALDITKTKIVAPFPGILITRIAEQGDFLAIGAPCALIAQLNPIRITGSVSEHQIGQIKTGNAATVIIGERYVSANVTFISSSANDTTRTFDVELEADNPDMIKDGLTAMAIIKTGVVQAHFVPRRSLVLDDNGVLGVRLVTHISSDKNEGNVIFQPVTQLQDDQGGIWVTGLSGTLHLITRGQNYVTHGQRVVSTPQNPTTSSLVPSPVMEP